MRRLFLMVLILNSYLVFAQVTQATPMKKTIQKAQGNSKVGPQKASQEKQKLPDKKTPGTSAANTVPPNNQKPSSQTTMISKIEKNPKAIFLIKRSKVDSEIGEPVIYPFERQLNTLYYDLPGGEIKNE